MCNKADNSCREEKLGCEGCFYNKNYYIEPNDYISVKSYLLSRFNTLYSDERIKKSVFILLRWIDYQDELIKNELNGKRKIIGKVFNIIDTYIQEYEKQKDYRYTIDVDDEIEVLKEIKSKIMKDVIKE